jgi:hypothetical protein
MQHVAVGRYSEMFGHWHSGMMLLFESSNVIGLRLSKIAHGGGDAIYETQLMIVEKLAAAIEAGTSVMTGATAVEVTERYRGHVAANARRLAADQGR